jgi:hypothetical protein
VRALRAALIAAVLTCVAALAAPASADAACHWEWIKITKRKNVSCRFAKIIVADYWGKDDPRANEWRCLSDPPGYVAGRCRHGDSRFRFKPSY